MPRKYALTKKARKRRKKAKEAEAAKLVPPPQNKEGYDFRCPECHFLMTLPVSITQDLVLEVADNCLKQCITLLYSLCPRCLPLEIIKTHNPLPCPFCGKPSRIPAAEENLLHHTLRIVEVLAFAWCPSCTPRPEQPQYAPPAGGVVAPARMVSAWMAQRKDSDWKDMEEYAIAPGEDESAP